MGEKEAEERRVKEEEERIKAEKEETERKSKEEAEKREAELQEKLRKEEEERLARKKRIEEIMARTRGKGGANTPKKEVKEESVKFCGRNSWFRRGGGLRSDQATPEQVSGQ